MEIFVGTSGWLYDWNEGASLDWYVEESGLNAVELNASFYRFPFKNQVASWSKKGKSLRWSIKVHRFITHIYKLSEKAFNTWLKFESLFEPMKPLIDFYLFQLPPNYSCKEENLDRIALFNAKSSLKLKMAVEFRHESCFNKQVESWAESANLVLVSIDAPIATWIVQSHGIVYLRMHGRSAWYGHDYSEEELRSVARSVLDRQPKKVYVFFNNNHWMLGNARFMKKLLEELSRI